MTATHVTSREVRLVARPSGWPQPEDFEVAEVPVTEPPPGHVLVRNLHLSVDPYMRGRMNDQDSYVPPFELDQPMEGGAVGRVVSSRAPELPEGTHVLHPLGWREYAVLDARQATPVPTRFDNGQTVPLSTYLGVLGMTGLTAYAALVEVARLREGDVVFVSAAAGAVGSAAGQIARLRGASRVIGSAGTPEKVRLLLDEYGFDAAFDYRAGSVVEQLRSAAPEGIDVYLDNVGGDHLEAAIDVLRVHGRVAMCGMISQYNTTEATAAPHNLAKVIGKRLTLRGMLVRDHSDLREQFFHEVGGWVRTGALKYQETVVEGIDNAVEAFIGMLRGENVGKMVVSLPE
ncbi:NADP-dependent oxidoreductase [Wenjunlia vitaminophila]|uniref:NADP-dependent oxidoreductase n=1 Tax=Wenjunlia vitaminophila TaxID=76728 RepID=A0A0T6LK92_WENVI|nr:NADP-dependent oxidoreductase [Wenjunlia vitaminophila]KRV46519.1 NADP-dependent oxidoreductase [Wenjunlia vitaminophila]